MSSLAERLLARKNAMATGAPAPAASPPPAPIAPPPAPPPAAMTMAERLLAKKAGTPAPAPPPAPAVQPINPPMEYQPPITAEQRAATEGAGASSDAGEKADAPKRTRRTKAQMEAARTAEVQPDLPQRTQSAPPVTEEEIPDEVGEIAEAACPALRDTPTPGFTLFIDCMPLGRSTEPAETLYAAVREHIFETQGLADYRYKDYGQGKADFQATLRTMAAEGMIVGNIFLATGSEEAALAMVALMPLARLVVRGV